VSALLSRVDRREGDCCGKDDFLFFFGGALKKGGKVEVLTSSYV